MEGATRDEKDSAWVKETLDAHNKLRAGHGAPPLEWSDECWASAKKAAENCATKKDLEHSHCEGPSGAHGQNGFEGSHGPYNPTRAVKAWYDEVKDYDFAKPGFAVETGHFAQVVWVDCTHVGLASSEDGHYIFANYLPPGIWEGGFEENVYPKDHAMQKRRDERLAEQLKGLKKKQLKSVRTMTPELKELIDMTVDKFYIDDSWTRECNKVFDSGGAVDCDFDPDGGSAERPFLAVEMPDGMVWQYPQ